MLVQKYSSQVFIIESVSSGESRDDIIDIALKF